MVSDLWLAAETVLLVWLKHLILPEKFAPPTLIQGTIAKTDALQWPIAHGFFGEWLTQLQSQALSKVFHTNEFLVFAAPDSTFGVAVMAIFHSFTEDMKRLCILHITLSPPPI